MERRSFLKTAVAGSVAAGFAGTVEAAEKYFPVKVDSTLFENINHAKDPANKVGLEKSHSPVITAPASVEAGKSFTVEVAVGETLHTMGSGHWIEFLDLRLGNQPIARADFQPVAYLTPKVTFNVIIPKDAAPDGKATLVARQNCNLHGLWESSLNIAVSL
jgi:superoxide reductase